MSKRDEDSPVALQNNVRSPREASSASTTSVSAGGGRWWDTGRAPNRYPREISRLDVIGAQMSSLNFVPAIAAQPLGAH